MKQIYFFGDSNTMGAGLEDVESYTNVVSDLGWAPQLGRAFNVPFQNLSSGGLSVKYIAAQIHRREFSSDDRVAILLPHHSAYCIISSDKKKTLHLQPDPNLDKGEESNIPRVGFQLYKENSKSWMLDPDQPRKVEIMDYYYENIYDEYDSLFTNSVFIKNIVEQVKYESGFNPVLFAHTEQEYTFYKGEGIDIVPITYYKYAYYPRTKCGHLGQLSQDIFTTNILPYVRLRVTEARDYYGGDKLVVPNSLI